MMSCRLRLSSIAAKASKQPEFDLHLRAKFGQNGIGNSHDCLMPILDDVLSLSYHHGLVDWLETALVTSSVADECGSDREGCRLTLVCQH